MTKTITLPVETYKKMKDNFSFCEDYTEEMNDYLADYGIMVLKIKWFLIFLIGVLTNGFMKIGKIKGMKVGKNQSQPQKK